MPSRIRIDPGVGTRPPSTPEYGHGTSLTERHSGRVRRAADATWFDSGPELQRQEMQAEPGAKYGQD